jgi:hypothetical protein
MGLADAIVMMAFGLFLGSAAVAAALAFGLGGRDAAARLLERASDKAQTRMATPPPSAPPASDRQPPLV